MGKQRAARRLLKTGASLLAVGASLLVYGALTSPAGASVQDPSPTPYEDDGATLDCEDLGFEIQFKIDEQPTAKTYTNGTYSVTISNVESPGGRLEFDWSSPQFWDVVLVKQANGGLKYEYDPAVKADQNVQTVAGQNQGGISHVTFCSDGVDPTTTTAPTTSEAPTTSAAPTTSSSVLGVVVTPTTAAAKVLGTQTLPITGSGTTALGTIGAGLVLLGVGLVLIGGRRYRLG